jgi:RNA polymerase sigma-70 factor (ECF subfamily)
MGGQLEQNVIRETHWAEWMRCAIAGDADSYQRFLRAVTPCLRTISRGHCELQGLPAENAEDIVQEILLTIHFKRGTWKSSRPIGPWISFLVSNKLATALRRRILTSDVMGSDGWPEKERGQGCIGPFLSLLNERQREVVLLISMEGAGVRETAGRLFLSERRGAGGAPWLSQEARGSISKQSSLGSWSRQRHQTSAGKPLCVVGAEASDDSRAVDDLILRLRRYRQIACRDWFS